MSWKKNDHFLSSSCEKAYMRECSECVRPFLLLLNTKCALEPPFASLLLYQTSEKNDRGDMKEYWLQQLTSSIIYCISYRTGRCIITNIDRHTFDFSRFISIGIMKEFSFVVSTTYNLHSLIVSAIEPANASSST